MTVPRQKTEHEKAINSLIPEAMKEARVLCAKMSCTFENKRGVDGKWVQHDYWTEFFHAKMNELAHEAGLRPML